MSKFNCMHMLACAWTGFLKWLMDARMIIILCICIFVYSFVVDPIMANAKLMNESINVLEPFIATLNSGMVLLIIPLGFLTLISDYPKIDDSSIFYIFRIGKKNWLFGQILQLLLMVVTYLLAIFTASVAGACMSGYIGKEWSRVTTNFVAEFPEQSGNFGALLLPENLYNQMTLPVALIESTLFVIMYLFFLGMLLLAFSVAEKKAAGLITCGLIIALGSAFCSINTKLMWMFPMPHAIVWLHYTKFLREPVVPIVYSVIYFTLGIVAELVFCIVSLKRFDYNTIALEVHS